MMKVKYDFSGSAEDIDIEYLQHLIDQSVVSSETLKSLEQLKQAGYKLYLVSNGIHYVQVDRVKHTGVIHYVDGFVTSEQAGKPKPHAPIFEHALRETATTPDEAFFIGDSYRADIIGAANMGINSCLISHESNIDWSDNKKPIMVVESFNDFAKFCLSG
jgi:putative hydrolase of the HAD superfamily